MITWHLHGQLDSCPPVSYRGAPADHAESQRIVAAMGEARRAFRAAANAYDFGAAVAAELTWRTHEEELRRFLEVLRHPNRRPFTHEEIDAALLAVRRRADAETDEPDEEDEELSAED